MYEEKYLRYLLFDRKSENEIWQLQYEDIDVYAEWNLVTDKISCQLEYLTNFLEEIYVDYNLYQLCYSNGHDDDKLKVESFIENKIGKIIEAWKVVIVGSSERRKKMFEELAQTLGASVVEREDAQCIFVDAELNRQQKEEIIIQLYMEPNSLIISTDWLIECYFCVSKVSVENFLISQFQAFEIVELLSE